MTDLGVVVAAAADAAAVALDKTPGQLAVLADAGVVDSGGRGLLVLLDALSRTSPGDHPLRPVYEPASPVTPAVPIVLAPPQFEVMYQVNRCDPAGSRGLRARLGGARRIGGHRGGGDGSSTRCMCTPTTPVPPIEAALDAGYASAGSRSWRKQYEPNQ